MLPFNDAAVPAVDVEAGTITVDPPAGLLDDRAVTGRRGEGREGED
jgi:hypothetical protein